MWIPREVYNRMRDDLDTARRERKEYLDLLLSPLRPVPDSVPPIGIEEAKEAADPETGVISAGRLRQMAQDAANKRAGKI